jgi:5-methylcytosine-specific restriction protein B
VRRVEWVIDQPVDLGPGFFLIPTVTRLRPEQCSQIKEAYLQRYPQLQGELDQLFPDAGPAPGPQPPVAAGPEMAVNEVLQQFGQVILYGPSGTGKTQAARRVARALLGDFDLQAVASPEEVETDLKTCREWGQFDIVVFHPAYEYEQFIGGIAPTVSQQGGMAYEVKPGAFLRLCRWAEANPEDKAVLIIDEINRGNLPKLLGELVYALEYRGSSVTLPFGPPVGPSELVIPHNLYIIGTMNSSDRSIGHIDVAVRRRFGLVHVGPDPEVVRRTWQQLPNGASYGDKLAQLMCQINGDLAGDDPLGAVELGVGHSYFLPIPGATAEAAMQQVRLKWEHQVQPLLREYGQLLSLQEEKFKRFFHPLDKILAKV